MKIQQKTRWGFTEKFRRTHEMHMKRLSYFRRQNPKIPGNKYPISFNENTQCQYNPANNDSRKPQIFYPLISPQGHNLQKFDDNKPFNDRTFLCSPFKTTKRLSYSDADKIPLYPRKILGVQESNVIRQILGPSPSSQFQHAKEFEQYLDSDYLDDGKENVNYRRGEYQQINNRSRQQNDHSQLNQSNGFQDIRLGQPENQFSFRKSHQQQQQNNTVYDYHSSPVAKNIHQDNINNSNQDIFNLITSRQCIPHVNTPIKSNEITCRNQRLSTADLNRRYPEADTTVPFFLQERKITHMR